MTDFNDFDREQMTRALQLAEHGRYSAHPNPMVGCVIVSDGEVVGEGWHAVAGEAHAEIHALQEAGASARGATVYVTLEPCVHHGKTPPCTEALIKAGVADVIVGLQDPNPKVSGAGIDSLEAAGINVRSGLLEAESRDLIRGFIKRVTQGRPCVRLKVAASIDGCIAMANGQSQWSTGAEARADGQKLRASSGAVMTGIGTVLIDDPSLTVRDASLDTRGQQPLRVVLDNELRMPLSAEMLGLPGKTLVYCINDRNRQLLVGAGAEVIKVEQRNALVDVGAVLDDLAARGINEVLVEAGPILCGSLIDGGFVDELVIYQAPHIMGSETRGMFQTPTWTKLTDRRALEITDVRQLGDDRRITAQLAGH
jgi:diaminohydroxyphosphoribosylaminopyrimidine deaminase/5-amino-6-(5-phosphoribosylamino)uracil reductase